MWKYVVVALFAITLAACAAIKNHPAAVAVSVVKGVGVTIQSLNKINNCEVKPNVPEK